ncbi:MAG: glycosyltransferase family 2 protein, partial [Caulobacteraceae bacterium]
MVEATSAPATAPTLSIVVPVFNERDAAPGLAYEIEAAFTGQSVEILFVDDASEDGTAEVLAALTPRPAALRLLRHSRRAGQSRAIRTGVLAAKAEVIVTLDGDGQNVPADAPGLVRALEAGGPGLAMAAGVRVARQDSASRRLAARLANAIRRRVLADGASDTGCGLKAFRRSAFLALPFFDHMHRYLPALMMREGFEVAFAPVSHRPRVAGRSKYTNLGRLGSALVDLGGVVWLKARAKDPGAIDSDFFSSLALGAGERDREAVEGANVGA